ncbi:pentapeptide repeat-containing protein [Mangrovicoccus sp. HB161399]|uniref:pentapeptide repeat-containing protein n=1 Tax=Mangrovicoccus sp. HB161399 TaxID=2720392 RepID=UPI0015523C92|nr:pentapeptide repeat-containing protein [Mangrovicoccus sp. HB161399]
MTSRLFPDGRPRAALPVSPEQDGTGLAIARINDLTRAGRANWFGLLAYLAFVTVTLLGVENIDFFLDSRQTELPLVGVSIPTASFFVAAPILGAALHVYLHLFVRKSTAALMVPPAEVNGARLEAHVLPWLLNDLVLRWRGDGSAEARPLDLLATVTAILLIWCAGPLMLGYAWWRSWPAHDPVMSCLALASFAVALYASLVSLLQMRCDLARRPRRAEAALIWELAATATMLVLGAMTADKVVEGNLAGANLREAVLTPQPADWLPYEIHKRRFRIEWCAREGLDAETCGPPHFSDAEKVPHLDRLREVWCKHWSRRLGTEDCATFFAKLDKRFPDAWAMERSTKRGMLTRWAPDHADLRGADLSSAGLQAADLREARMEGADFSSARMEGADLSLAQMEGANFSEAQMEGADLSFAYLAGTREAAIALNGTNLSASLNYGGALRFVFLRGIKFDAATDWRIAFLDGSVILPAGFPEPVTRACGWITAPIEEDVEFFGKWRGWLEAGTWGSDWEDFAPDPWREVQAILPPPDCQWDTSPLPGAL